MSVRVLIVNMRQSPNRIQRCSINKGVLKTFVSFTEKRPVLESDFSKVY